MKKKPTLSGVAQQYELTQSQQLLWLGQQLSPFSPQYNMAFSFTFSTSLQVKKFQQAFQLLVEESEVMRSSFLQEDAYPRQYIRGALLYELPLIDFSQVEDTSVAVQHWIDTQVKKVLPIDQLLFDSALLKLAPEKYIWYLNQHHLITDGWSITIQYHRMLTLYINLCNNAPLPLKSLPTYSDYIRHERQQAVKVKEMGNPYWKEQIQNLPEIPSLYAKQNPLANTFIHRNTIHLSKQQVEKIRLLMGQTNMRTWTPDLSQFLFFSTILALAVYRISGKSSFAIGTPVHNRSTPVFKKTIGVFIELFPFQVQILPDDTFQSLFERIRDEYYQFMRHATVAKSTAALSKTFNVVINYINAAYPTFDAIPAKSEWLNAGHIDPGHHLKLQIFDFDKTGRLTLTIDGNTAIFKEAQLAVLSDYIQYCIDVYTEQQSIPLQLLMPTEQQQLLAFNQTAFDCPSDVSIIDLFRATVAAYPQQPAVVVEHQQLTFLELEEKSNQLAHQLLELGVDTEDLVAIYINRSLEMMVSLLGILKAGAAYVPIDPAYPTNRVDYTLKDAQAQIVICSKEDSTKFINNEVSVITLEPDWFSLKSYPTTAPAVKIRLNQLMYVMYTSGSTGKPKGVMNEHGALLNRLLWAKDYFNFYSTSDIFLQKTTFCFDVSVWELFMPLLSGNPLLMAEPGGHKDNTYLQRVIEEQKVSIIHFVPPMLEVFLLSISKDACPSLKKIICSGEALKGHQIALSQEKLPHVEIYNLYGPTEAAIHVTAYKAPSNFKRTDMVPIGKPVANIQLFILNNLGLSCPIGVPGDLYIGGVQVARGYHNNPTLSAEKFVHQTINNKEQRLYKTGDIAQWLPNGEILFLGRADSQVKIRGFRIETTEVEITLGNIKGVEQAVVLVKTDKFGNNYLIGYYVSKNAISKSELLVALKKELPAYAIPTHLIALEALPLNINGKIDRALLPLPKDFNLKDNLSYVPPSNEFEEIIQQVWMEVLDRPVIGVHDNFMEIGGESLMSIRVITRLENAFEIDLPTSLIFNYPTISESATYIENIITELLQQLEEQPS